MYTKTITYTDFLGKERTETYHFNMTEVELLKWVSQPGGYSQDQVLQSMLAKENNEGLMDLLESLIKTSYGEISLDGKRFIKSKEVQEEFFETNAYPKIFLELATDTNEATKFFNEVFPANLEDTIKKIRERNEKEAPKESVAAIAAKEAPVSAETAATSV